MPKFRSFKLTAARSGCLSDQLVYDPDGGPCNAVEQYAKENKVPPGGVRGQRKKAAKRRREEIKIVPSFSALINSIFHCKPISNTHRRRPRARKNPPLPKVSYPRPRVVLTETTKACPRPQWPPGSLLG